MHILAALLIAIATPAAAEPRPVTGAAALQPDGTHLLVHEVIVDAAAAEVWLAISTAEGWKRWAAPVAWASAPDIIETSYSADARPGDPSTIQQQVLFRAPGRLMLFRTIKAPARFPDFDTYGKVTSLFEVEPLGPGRSRVRLSGYGYADSEAGRRLLGFFERGNAVSLEALRKSFAAPAAANSR